MKKILLLVLIVSVRAFAQTDDEAIKLTLNYYQDGLKTGDTAKLNRAFHPLAVQRYLSKEGQLRGMTSKEFVAKAPAGGLKCTTNTIHYSYIGQVANATVEIVMDAAKMVDYLSLMKIGNDWKIVARVYTRAEVGQEIQGIRNSAPVSSSKSSSTKKATPTPKPKSDDGW